LHLASMADVLGCCSARPPHTPRVTEKLGRLSPLMAKQCTHIGQSYRPVAAGGGAVGIGSLGRGGMAAIFHLPRPTVSSGI